MNNVFLVEKQKNVPECAGGYLFGIFGTCLVCAGNMPVGTCSACWSN